MSSSIVTALFFVDQVCVLAKADKKQSDRSKKCRQVFVLIIS